MKTSILFFAITVMVLFSLFLNDDTSSSDDLTNYINDKDYIEGEIIVMFKESVNAQDFLNNYTDIGMTVKEVLVKDMNI